MSVSKRSSAHASNVIVERIRITIGTMRQLRSVGKAHGIRYNIIGRLLEECPELIAQFVSTNGFRVPVRFGRLAAPTVRAVRKSKDKRASIAAQHQISEAMVRSIRARKSYRWVR